MFCVVFFGPLVFDFCFVFFRSLAQEAAAHRRLQTEATSRTIKMTPDILAGLLFLLLFLFILVTGLGCVGDIECPQHYNHEKPAPGKDY